MKFIGGTISSDPNIIGVDNGTYQFEILQKSFFSKAKYEEFYDYYFDHYVWDGSLKKPEIKTVEGTLLNNAKITDFLCFSPGLMRVIFALSEKAFNILKNFNLFNNENLHLKLVKGNEIIKENFFLLCYPFLQYESINFSKSIIYSGTALSNKKYHTITSVEEYQAFIDKYPISEFEKVVLVSSMPKYDLIRVRGVSTLFFSERLHEKIVNSKLKGLVFNEKYMPKLEIE